MKKNDITHCTGIDIESPESQSKEIRCEIREECYRYQAYLDLKGKSGLYSFIMPSYCIKNNHELFWKGE